MEMVRYRSLLLLGTAIAVISCAGPDESGHRFRVGQQNGMPVAETTGGPKFTDDLFSYEEVLRILPDEEQPETLLHLPAQFTLGDDGNYYVCDNGSYRVAVFDADGHFVRSFGRQGGGPGEFQSMGIVDLSDGVLTIFDTVQQRTSMFTTDGAFIRQVTIHGGEIARELVPLEEDLLLSIYRTSEMKGEEQWEGMKGLITAATRDTVALLEVPPAHLRMWIRGANSASFYVYFTAFPRVGYSWSRGLFLYDPRQPELRWFDRRGSLSRIDRIDLPRIPPSREDRQLMERYWDRRIEEAEERARASARTVRDNLTFGEYVPFWTTVTVDDAGYCWLGQYEPTEKKEEAGGSAFRVLSPEGEYLGDTRWPFVAFADYLVRGVTIANGYLLAIERNPETYEMIPTVYRISPAVAGLKYRGG
jgi:hypothetical protein